jgi:UPF0271 protein
MNHPDLNCDLGEHEAITTTAALMECIGSANIACGGHAGTTESMHRCIDLALRCGVKIGAHPGLMTDGGRGQRFPSASELRHLLEEQVLPFQEMVRSHGATLHHIKLHGTLYHATDQVPELAEVYLQWCTEHMGESYIYCRSGAATSQLAASKALPCRNECFLDRAYEADGSLRARHHADAVFHELADLQHRLELWRDQQVLQAHSGEHLSLACDTFCLHSDSPQALTFARFAKQFFAQH